MQIKEAHISYKTTGRYYTFGNPETASHLIFALHGYAQLAVFFIRKFNTLDSEKYFVICPEAPHRFYNTGSAGRVGASWMTKEDRLTDINNYVCFLDTLLDQVNTQYNFKESSLLGFSQGGATASRWIGYGNCKFDKFLLWAAVFPPDMTPTAMAKFKTYKNYFIIGDKDEFTTLEQAKIYYNSLNTDGLQVEFITFEGNHTINSQLLKTLLK